MGNQQSNTHSGSHGSVASANSNDIGDYSGSSGSNDVTRPSNIVGSRNVVGSRNISGSRNIVGSDNIIHNYCCHEGGTDLCRSHAEILQCLYTSKYEEHRDRIRKPVEGTCTWVTEHSKYKDWLKGGSSGVLWLSADPGCGKSVIASYIVKHLESQTDATVCYFFFKDDSEEQRSAAFALCAILHQILKRRANLIEFVREEFRAKGKGFTKEVNTLWNILVKAVAEGGCGEVICVVDAMDECEEKTLDQLIRHVAGLPCSQTPDIPLKFLVTGRPYHKLEREFGSPGTTIRLKGEEEVDAITSDVNRVIDDGIKNMESYWERPGGLGYLRDLLKSSADRTFLWVSLVLETLKDCEGDSVEEFTNIVSTAPRDIADLYTNMLNKSRYPDNARRILNIVVAAARPLTLSEMQVAFKIKREHKSVQDLGDVSAGFSKSVKNWCGLFVRVIDSKIYLVHQTAREFLIKRFLSGQGNWQYTFCSIDSNILLADICISYLSLEDFGNDPLPINPYRCQNDEEYVGYLRKYPFLHYAATNWADHFRDSQTRQMELFPFTRLICEGVSKASLTWFRVYWEDQSIRGPRSLCPNDFTHLMISSWLGQKAVVEQLLKEGGDINARSRGFGTALSIAAFRKEKDISRVLVQSNVKTYIWGKEFNILHTKRSELLAYDEKERFGGPPRRVSNPFAIRYFRRPAGPEEFSEVIELLVG